MKTTITFLFLFASVLISAQETNIHDINPKDYGQNHSIGLHIFDGIGLITRKVLKNDDQLEAAISYRGFSVVDDDFELQDYYHGGGITIGYNFFCGDGVKITKRKEKLKKHYLSLKAEASTFTVKRVSLAITWHKEMFFLDRPNASKGIDLGLRFAKYIDYELIFDPNSPVELFLRWDWNWFRG